jgi:saccharopine dehydrogenase (NAD+, L-lysine-forming)
MLRPWLMHSSVGKALEHRSALTPTTAKTLIEAGYTVRVERSPERIFEDSEFEEVGATLVPENTWREAPTDHIIIGLKELPVEECESNCLSLVIPFIPHSGTYL